MKNVLITGANGQLGRCLQDLSKTDICNDYQFHFTDVNELDICQKTDIEKYVSELGIDIIINAAAYTAVDKAEDDDEAAYLLNRDAVGNIAEVCACKGIYFVHISTDYVFDGELDRPYNEFDKAGGAKSVYGKSKFAGEEAIKHNCHDYCICRIS